MSKVFGDRIAHILEAGSRIRRHMEGITADELGRDELLLAGVKRWFGIIGEAAATLGKLEKGQFPNVPWRKIVAFRNRVVHDYADLSHDRLLGIVSDELPALLAVLRREADCGRTYPFPIKICGISTSETMTAALHAGADMIGLNFHPKSPRRVTLPQAAELAEQARGRTIVAALVVDAEDSAIDAIMRAVEPDLLQLHGAESPARCASIAERFERPVMRALGVAISADLDDIALLRPHVDRLLLDAKPPKDAAYPGGHGKTFDWAILRELDPFMPFMLSGGLTPENVGEAIRTVRGLGVTLAGVDVSSGVESAPGVKDPEKIRAFVENARKALS